MRPIAPAAVALATLLAASSAPAQRAPKTGQAERSAGDVAATQQAMLPIGVFFALLGNDKAEAQLALARIGAGWRDGYAAMLLELVGFVAHPEVQRGVLALLQRVSGRALAGDVNAGYQWLWSIEPVAHPEYAEFKAALYEQIDPRFGEYFSSAGKTTIRLDEIRWGGVARDGIPPLKNPKMIGASEAAYLGDDNVVFGVAIDGDVRAYPKRILAWHEMVKDRIAGRELNGVYCTLCGSMILYDTTIDGVHHELGTSGFLYRSNKLMYDHATKSMWSTLSGTPVVGPLVGKGIELKTLYVVTTTWKQWKTRHPDTRVLSLDTGHQRDYSEGAAYRSYFATDQLMFNVPKLDNRLANKAEVLALRFADVPHEQLAISAAFLLANRVHHDRIGRRELVVLTDPSGANRVYETRGTRFERWDSELTARDSQGLIWRVEEDRLSGPDGRTLARLPAHRAFWFGWYAAYPNTRLLK